MTCSCSSFHVSLSPRWKCSELSRKLSARYGSRCQPATDGNPSPISYRAAPKSMLMPSSNKGGHLAPALLPDVLTGRVNSRMEAPEATVTIHLTRFGCCPFVGDSEIALRP